MPRPPSNIRARIITAARQRFLRDGVAAASLRHIARTARTSIGMIYYYFPTKNELFLAVVEDVYAGVLEDISGALAPDVPVDTRLARLYQRLGALSEAERDVLRLVMREALVSSKHVEPVFERFKSGHIPLILATLNEGVTCGALRRDLHPLVLLLSTLALGGLAQLARNALAHALGEAHVPSPAVCGAQLFDVLMRGAATSGAPRAARRG